MELELLIIPNAGFTMWQHWKEERDRIAKDYQFDQEGVSQEHDSSYFEHDRGHYERHSDIEIR